MMRLTFAFAVLAALVGCSPEPNIDSPDDLAEIERSRDTVYVQNDDGSVDAVDGKMLADSIDAFSNVWEGIDMTDGVSPEEQKLVDERMEKAMQKLADKHGHGE